jgi:hypothetical protein
MPGDGPFLRRVDCVDLVLELVIESLIEHQRAPHVAAVEYGDRDELQCCDRTYHEVVIEQDRG